MNYLQEIENEFSRLRGRWTNLAPLDWQLAENWDKQGIPLSVVFRAMGDVKKAFDASNRKDSINSLRYFEKAVEKEFAEWQTSQVGKSTGPDVDPSSSFVSIEDMKSEFIVGTDENQIILNQIYESLDKSNKPEPLRSAITKVKLQILDLIQKGSSLSTDEIEDSLEQMTIEFELSLAVSVPESLRLDLLNKIKCEYANVRTTPETRQKILMNLVYKYFGIPKLTLFEL